MNRIAALTLVATLIGPPASAQEGHGLTKPVVLAPFQAGQPACAPAATRTRSLVFLRDNERDFMGGVDAGLSMAARDRGLNYRVELADNDVSRQASQTDRLATDGTAAVIVAPIDARGLGPRIERLLNAGVYVGSVVPPPATTILNAPQYLTGKVLGDAAADYIRTTLGGEAHVVLLTHDSLEFLAPRFAAMRDSLAIVPGATIVADISPVTVDKAGGYAIMQTILLAEPRIDVVLGADTVILGALDALRDAGAARPDQFVGGIDGEPEAVAELKTDGSPYKVTVSLASPIFGYALGQQAADFLEGAHVPQAMDILPFLLTADNLAGYEADTADPAAIYRDPARRSVYLRMYGDICTDTRDRYLNFPWSSEG